MDLETEVIVEHEDGEISDDDEVYKPLERPPNYSANINPRIQTQDKQSEDESPCSSESDSDSDESYNRAKKSKIKINRKILSKPTGKRKKYDIWSSRVQEDVLAETLISCDVSRIDRSRNVESYNHKNYSRQGNKRRYGERGNVKLRLGKREKKSDDEDDIKGSVRTILDLVTNVDNTEEELARDIANKLCEEKDDLLLRIVKIAGKKKAIDIFNDTKRIEEDGGMLIMNQTRRRTPGGVFIFLLKRDDDVTEEQQKEIFQEERQARIAEQKLAKKVKAKKLKAEIAARKAAKNVQTKIPELLTRAELTVKQLTDATRARKQGELNELVNNPPPSPVTDGKENSSDGMNDVINPSSPHRDINAYEDDFLDIGCNADMDVF